MNISGIRPSYGSYSVYNNEIMRRPMAAAVDELSVSEQPKQEAKVSDAEIAQARAKQTFGSLDYAAQYNPSATYETKGFESDINSLDVSRALGDAAKDNALQQYQYFVGDRNQNAIADSAVAARGAENFTL